MEHIHHRHLINSRYSWYMEYLHSKHKIYCQYTYEAKNAQYIHVINVYCVINFDIHHIIYCVVY